MPRVFAGVLDEYAGAHEGAGDAPDESVEQVRELLPGRCGGTVEAGVSALEGVGAVQDQHVQVDVEIER